MRRRYRTELFGVFNQWPAPAGRLKRGGRSQPAPSRCPSPIRPHRARAGGMEDIHFISWVVHTLRDRYGGTPGVRAHSLPDSRAAQHEITPVGVLGATGPTRLRTQAAPSRRQDTRVCHAPCSLTAADACHEPPAWPRLPKPTPRPQLWLAPSTCPFTPCPAAADTLSRRFRLLQEAARSAVLHDHGALALGGLVGGDSHERVHLLLGEARGRGEQGWCGGRSATAASQAWQRGRHEPPPARPGVCRIARGAWARRLQAGWAGRFCCLAAVPWHQ
jgi:hypothetical protein